MKIYMNNQVHPVLRDILNNFATETLTPIQPIDEFEEFEEYEFLKSDYCTECGGGGYRTEKTWTCPLTGFAQRELEQCESCEELHDQEVRADRMHDEMKGN